MATRSLVSELAHLFNLFLAFEHKRRGRYVRARNRLDKALSLTNDAKPYLMAFDGVLMVSEDRHECARKRFRESLTSLQEVMDAEKKYVTTYCRLWLVMYEGNCAYEEIERLWEKAHSLEATGTEKALLRLPPKDALRKEFGNRRGFTSTARL